MEMIGIPITVAWVEETEVVPLVVVASKLVALWWLGEPPKEASMS